MSLCAVQLNPPSIPTTRVEELDIDVERGERSFSIDKEATKTFTSVSAFEAQEATTASTSVESFDMKETNLPPKKGFHGQRWLRYRAFMLYRRFLFLILFGNIAAACVVLYWRLAQGRFILEQVSLAFAINLTQAVIMRSEPVIHVLFTVCASVPQSWPLAIRCHAAKIFHLGK